MSLLRIQNIEEMRRQEGIIDDELRKDIGALHVGDVVRLTIRASEKCGEAECILVRITAINKANFEGTLTEKPRSKALAHMDIGAPLAFAAAHIHSLAKKPEAHG